MATSSIVFEVMIHCLDADIIAAKRIQAFLRTKGLRVGIERFVATDSARHSLCFIGENFEDQSLSYSDLEFYRSVLDESLNIMLVDERKPLTSSLRNVIDRVSTLTHAEIINSDSLQERTRLSYDSIAEQFTDVWFDTLPLEALETFVNHIPKGGRILDAGCGPGHHACFFKKRGFEPVGVDFSKGMLRVARAKNKSIPFQLGDILSTKLPAAYFDGVWSAVMLNHIPSEHVRLALHNMVSALKWQGYIGLNFQVGRPSEVICLETDRRFFEYPSQVNKICELLKGVGIRVVNIHSGVTNKNIHNVPLRMKFATVVGQKVEQSKVSGMPFINNING